MSSPPQPQVPKQSPGARDGPVELCPVCNTARTDRYCEECAFDFEFAVGSPGPCPAHEFHLPEAPLSDPCTSSPLPPPAQSAQPAPIESAQAAVQRSSEPAIVDELITGGAVAASFTAAAAITKAKIEATTQRRRNALDAETRRLEIESQERQAALQQREETKRARITARSQVQHPASEDEAG
ncbi:hypothetical protein AB0N07_44060 [Streptomyces sp. NPDC051172]|uniref:hypothetical protein n=1 Tax=Streptomyces sp. NPDC051172 TaxID=3155796 RepID=UPI0034460B48